MNTTHYSAGRICYPGFYDAVQGGVREDLARDKCWWPGLDIPNPRWRMFGSAEPSGKVRERRVRSSR